MSDPRGDRRWARVFVALELPDAVRAGIEDWGRRQLRDPELRRVAAAQAHVTLAFLGRTGLEEVPRLSRILDALAQSGEAPRVTLGDPEPRPRRGRPRLFALPVEAPGAVALEAELRARLVAADLYEPEGRPFWPHVTVARVRRPRPEEGARDPSVRPPGPLPGALRRPFVAVRVTLYRSDLQLQGAQYTPLAQVELPEAGGSEVR